MNERESQRQERLRELTRRTFFKELGYGIGSLALSQILHESLFANLQSLPAQRDPLFPKPPHFAPRAKSIIYLFMAGAPSQLDLFDPKPELSKRDGESCPEELIKGERFAFIKGVPTLLASPYQFRQHGKAANG